MTEIKQRLFDAFKQDHALLGSSFFVLATCLRDNDIAGARELAVKISMQAGPHIAFEEEEFYPALKRFLDQDEIDAMYLDHDKGRMLLENISRLDASVELDDAQKKQLLAEVEHFESHVSECGELFGVMGGLSDAELEHLLERLNHFRLQAPHWLAREPLSDTDPQ